MKNKCLDCPKTKEYIDLGRCPCCGAASYLMSTQTHVAVCRICGIECGIPMGIPMLCGEDKMFRFFIVTIYDKLTTQQVLDFSKLMGMNGAQTYRLFKNGIPVVIENVATIQAYKIRNFCRVNYLHFEISPSLDQYPYFEDCFLF